MVRYFLGFTGKTLPFKPKDEVSREEALANNPYCIVEYEDGRIVRFTKMLDGERFFDHQFTYSQAGKVETVVLTRADGSQRRMGSAGGCCRLTGRCPAAAGPPLTGASSTRGGNGRYYSATSGAVTSRFGRCFGHVVVRVTVASALCSDRKKPRPHGYNAVTALMIHPTLEIRA